MRVFLKVCWNVLGATLYLLYIELKFLQARKEYRIKQQRGWAVV